MNQDIAGILKTYLQEEIYVDKLSGMVRPVSIAFPTSTPGRVVYKTFPIACDVPYEGCQADTMNKDMIPDDTKRSIIYFEDGGVDFEKRENNLMFFNSRLKIIGWINLRKFKHSGCSLSSTIVTRIIRKLPTQPVNNGIYTRLHIVSISQAVKHPNIFSPYSYNETETQYLVYPFDYFALNISVKFAVNKNCLNEIELDDAECHTD